MSSESGFNQDAADAAVDNIISGGADVRLMTTALDYDDTASDLDTKKVDAADYDAVSVPEADWDVSFDVAGNELTLTNNDVVDFGDTENDWGVVVDIAIHDAGTDLFIIADEVNDPDITEGETVRFPAGEIVYTLGPDGA